jgi:hypothetical protein
MTTELRTNPTPDVLRFQVGNVTGTQELPFEVVSGVSVRSVADAIASRMTLPSDVPWALRDDSSSTYLDDERPIGGQIKPGSHVTITPRAHLG